jgi:hypothetical protein
MDPVIPQFAVLDAAQLLEPTDAGIPHGPASEDPTTRLGMHLLHWLDALLAFGLAALLIVGPLIGSGADDDDERIQRVGVAVVATCSGQTTSKHPTAIISYAYAGKSYSRSVGISASSCPVGQRLDILVDPSEPLFIGYPDGTADAGSSKRIARGMAFAAAGLIAILIAVRLRSLHRLVSVLKSTPGVRRTFLRTAMVRWGRGKTPVLVFDAEPSNSGTHLVARCAIGSRAPLRSLRATASGTPMIIVPMSRRVIAVVPPGRRPFFAVLPPNERTAHRWLLAR